MSIIIRLQGLPNSASSLDIRRFFRDLSIPDGGVHIIGGELGDAFIAFTNDEDARQAMARENSGLIKDTKIKLYLSSRNEMKQVIDKARNLSGGGAKAKSADQLTHQASSTSSAAIGNGSSTIKSLNILNSNLSQPINAEKLNQVTGAQISYSNRGSVSSNNAANLVTNLQETPDYRRIRSPVDKATADRLNKDRSNSPYGNQRVKQLLEQVRGLDSNAASSTVRSRLGGFNLPSSPNEFEHHQSQQANRWNSSINGNANNGLMNGIPTQPINRMPNANGSPFPDQLHHQYAINDSSTPFNHLQPNRFVVELRGLPINVQTVDFQTFFRPVGILIDRDQIKLSLDDKALFHGVAHIFFNNEEDLEKALLLNGRSIRDYRIEVLPVVQTGPLLNTPLAHANSLELIGQHNFNNDLLNRNGENASFSRRRSFYSAFMKGIPYEACTYADVTKFFEPIPIFEIIIIQERSGRPTGNAYLIFDSKDCYDLAMKRNSRYMGKRYIELFSCPVEEIESYRARLLYRQQQRETGDSDEPTHLNRKRRRSADRSFDGDQLETIYCVQIRGLPPNVDNRDLTNYFLEFGITASAVHIMLKPDGMNAGECFVEFKSHESLTKALRQNGDRLGNYLLSIKEISYAKVSHIVGLQSQMSKMSKPGRDPLDDRRSTVLATGMSARATISDICAFFQDYNLRPSQIEPKLDRDGQRGDEVFIHFRNPKEADRVIRNMNRKYFIDKLIYLKHV